MDRRDFLRTTGAAAAAATVSGQTRAKAGAGAVAAPNILANARTLRLALAWPDNCRGPGESARRIAQAIEQAADGRLRFEFVSTPAPLEALRSGGADISFACASSLVALARANAYFTGLPGQHGLTAQQLAQWHLVGGGEALWDDLAASHGMKFLLAGHTGASSGLWSKAPIESDGALHGKTLWAAGLAGDVIRGLGAEPSTAMPAGIGDGIAAEAIGAADVGGMISAFAAGLLEAAPHRLPCSINTHGTALALGFTRTLWESFPGSEKAIVTGAAQAEYHTMVAEEMAHRQLFPATHPEAAARSVAGAIEQAVHRVSDAVVAHLAAEDRACNRINASYMAFKAMMPLPGAIA